MKKKRIIYLSLTIVTLFAFIIFFSKKNFNKEGITFEESGIKYALTVDGKKAYKFPDKGYYNVKVKCDNARGKWLYDDWKLSIDNIVGNVTCNIKFTSSTKTNLNDYLNSLKGTKQGDGKFAAYTYKDPARFYTAIAKTLYTSTSTSSFSWDTTSLSWKSTNHTDSSQATISFKISTAGNYSFCYTQISEIWSDYATLYKNNVEYISLENKAASTKVCTSEFSVSTSDVFKVVYAKDSSYSYGDDQVTFSFSKKGAAAGSYVSMTHANYEGANPNNYIYFNDELWRIVGLFDSYSHGQSGKNLVKIVRAEPIGMYGYNSADENDWPNATLNKILNGAYYNAQNGTSNSYCTAYMNLSADCDFTIKGIKDTYRNMIVNATWYLGELVSEDANKEEFFKCERETPPSSDTSGSASTTAYIGLLYPSDYGYSVDNNLCSTAGLRSYKTSNCAGTSWLRGGGAEWFITPSSSGSNQAYSLEAEGNIDSNSSIRARYVRPTLYLNESVYVYAGDGSIENPYIIGM